MADVFISYCKPDAAAVRRLADAVRRLGYSVWWDDELPAHLSYSDVIADRIETARAAIVVWSESAAASQWVRAEADLARHQAKLIQASVDGRMPPMPFNQIQCAVIGDWRGEEEHPGWQKVKASLDALVGPRAPSAAAPPAAAPPRPPHKWHKLLIGVIAVAFLLVAGAGLYAWLFGGAPARPDAPPPSQNLVQPAAPPPQTPQPEPDRERREAKPEGASESGSRDRWRRCREAGHDRSECRGRWPRHERSR